MKEQIEAVQRMQNYISAHLKKSNKKYDPASIGFTWNMESPRIQLEPIGTRGYIELLLVKTVISFNH